MAFALVRDGLGVEVRVDWKLSLTFVTEKLWACRTILRFEGRIGSHGHTGSLPACAMHICTLTCLPMEPGATREYAGSGVAIQLLCGGSDRITNQASSVTFV